MTGASAACGLSGGPLCDDEELSHVTPPTRRTVLAALAVVPVAGCLVQDGGEGPTDSGSTDDGGNETATETNDEPTGPTVEDLPEPSPLAGVLVDLVSAEDRAAFLSSHDLDAQEGAVRVELSLVDGGEPPTAYLPEEYTAYQSTVIAYVDVDDLVALALTEDVRFVGPKIDPQTEGQDGP